MAGVFKLNKAPGRGWLLCINEKRAEPTKQLENLRTANTLRTAHALAHFPAAGQKPPGGRHGGRRRQRRAGSVLACEGGQAGRHGREERCAIAPLNTKYLALTSL